jgi:putative GTP pyrophosphokinase
VPSPVAPSKKSIDRAGSCLRDWWLGDDDFGPDEGAAGDLLLDWRSTFQPTLAKVTVGVRQFVARESETIVVSQRLKRLPTIVDKLARFPNMKVTRMQDIGGCRAILGGGAGEVDGVFRRIRKNWEIVRVFDYEREPKETGYRALHIVVDRDRKMIEIQLRTPNQHRWATEVDRTGARLGVPLKDGVGPADLLLYFRHAAELLALEEAGERADRQLMADFGRLRDQVRRYFVRG